MWKYEQSTGNLYQPDDTLLATGYSGGNEGENPEGVNNPSMQNIKRVGPIPVGFYTFGEVVLKSHLGPFAIPLMPDKDNEMFGRSGFYMHGDHDDTHPPQSASEGCIIVPRAVREEVYASLDRILQVTSNIQQELT
jgi:hypothetical protein